MQNKITINDNPEWFNSYTYEDLNYNWIGRQGWICPKCGRVFSPDTSMCFYCGSAGTIINTTTTSQPPLSGAITVKANGDEDWLKTYLNDKTFLYDPENSPYYSDEFWKKYLNWNL